MADIKTPKELLDFMSNKINYGYLWIKEIVTLKCSFNERFFLLEKND